MISILYRADKRIFESGEKIVTAGEFTEKHPEAGRLAEALLERTRPKDKPKRNASLMLFEEESCARRYWAKMSNGRLYRISIDTKEIRHRGDMHLVDQIAARLESGATAEDLAEAYWRGATTETPCIEVLVNAGVVDSTLGSEAERIALFRHNYGIPEHPPETDEEFDKRVFGTTHSTD